jgi:hypothetical protein
MWENHANLGKSSVTQSAVRIEQSFAKPVIWIAKAADIMAKATHHASYED